MLLNIASTVLIRNVRPFGTVARSTWSNFFTKVREHPSRICGTAYHQSRSLTSDPTIKPLKKATDISLLSTQQRWSSTTHGDHVRVWVLEKLVSVALPILLPAAFILETPITDSLLALMVVMHTHWGLEVIILDYARPSVVGTVLPKLLYGLLYVISAATLAGLLMLIYGGPGLAKTCKDAWAIGNTKTE